jgi:hypothetical protein
MFRQSLRRDCHSPQGDYVKVMFPLLVIAQTHD